MSFFFFSVTLSIHFPLKFSHALDNLHFIITSKVTHPLFTNNFFANNFNKSPIVALCGIFSVQGPLILAPSARVQTRTLTHYIKCNINIAVASFF